MIKHFDAACEFKLGAGDRDGTIEGYASVFSLLDRGGDIVMPGAFRKSLGAWKKKKQMPPMLWQHDPHNPIGVWTDMEEDEKGLKVKGVLITKVRQAEEAHALIKEGAVNGLSIGYSTKKADIDRTTGARKLIEVELWEISPVTFPMMPEAQISGVKTFNPREFEKALRDGGLSNSDAKAATAIAKQFVFRDEERPEPALRDGMRDVLNELRKTTSVFRS